MKIDIKILDTDKQIALKVANALLPDVRKYFGKVVKVLQKELPDIVNYAIVSSPEYSSIIGGKLKYEFGIPNPQQKLVGLLDIWTKNINITYTPPIVSGGGQISSRISASMIKIDFSDVLYTEYAEVYDNQKGYTLPWLKWLLLEGSKVLVKDYQVIFGPSRRSRSGFALMRKSNIESWRVPVEFAGSQNDNWITRAIDKSEPDIYNLIEKALKQ